MLPQQYCLRWKYHHSNLQTMFSQLLDRGCFCDVTLACEGRTIRAHRVVLCACSTYFDQLLTNCTSSEKDPIIIMRDAKFEDIKCLIEFMYKGEINVEHGSLASLLKTAEELRIKGLAEVSWRDDESAGSDTSGTNNNNNNSLTVKNGNTGGAGNSGSSSSSIKIVETKKLLAPQHSQQGSASSLTPLTVSSLETRMADSPNLPLLTPLTAGSPLNPASCASPNNYFGNKKKRGRPPLDEEYDTFQQIPKIAHVEGGAGSSTPFTSTSQLVAVMMDDSSSEQTPPHHQLSQQHQQQSQISATSAYLEQQSRPPQTLHEMDFDEEAHIPRRLIPKLERPDTPQDYLAAAVAFAAGRHHKFEFDDSPPSPNDHQSSVYLTPEEKEEWKDVIQMNDYLTKGRRPQFWEEPFTKRVMDGIKNKTLEMKKAAKILGVSYGTLYGRYRETYGCLKHPYRGPFMAATRMNMWSSMTGGGAGGGSSGDVGVATTTDILGMLQRGIISLQRAAELMHTTPSTITAYLEQLQEAAASQPDPEHLAAAAAAAVAMAEEERSLREQHHQQQHQNSLPPPPQLHPHPTLSTLVSAAQFDQQAFRIKPEISISPLKKSTPPTSSVSSVSVSPPLVTLAPASSLYPTEVSVPISSSNSSSSSANNPATIISTATSSSSSVISLISTATSSSSSSAMPSTSMATTTTTAMPQQQQLSSNI
ncbi:uncharacterized protein LOC129739126 [Uranotaenia lowii]|uniref:uncharacterized protein LOC129739126 n=1 Tax=Uranotaenia lowii TaxID=190385 RepID=UPI002478D054|nr:uncharacterized protein LOC129739126 [Uranotaenia lowii]